MTMPSEAKWQNSNYAPGLYYVRYGGRGQQLAEILRGPSPSGYYVVRKFLKNSKRWTKEVRLYEGLILRKSMEAA